MFGLSDELLEDDKRKARRDPRARTKKLEAQVTNALRGLKKKLLGWARQAKQSTLFNGARK